LMVSAGATVRVHPTQPEARQVISPTPEAVGVRQVAVGAQRLGGDGRNDARAA
jgi:hypothetical protein